MKKITLKDLHKMMQIIEHIEHFKIKNLQNQSMIKEIADAIQLYEKYNNNNWTPLYQFLNNETTIEEFLKGL